MSTTSIHAESERQRSENTEHERQGAAARVCPECEGTLATDEGHGETICTSCGLVVEEDQVDRGPEWRAFDSREKDEKSRVGAPTTKMLHDKGLSSHIGWQDRDSYGNALSPRQRRKMQRLRTWDERFRTRNHKERNLKQALAEIERMGSALGLGDDVRETASVIYRRALEEAVAALDRSLTADPAMTELGAEDVRLAVRALGRITGQVDVEDILDVVFRDFGIGK
ncbi:MAG: TFIIB-type zinc ribbon-containing protein [Alphaproteobacteria bacterium]